MNCSWLAKLTDYECRAVSAVDGSRALEIATPFALVDGSPLLVYIIEIGDHAILSDNGDTMLHLSAAGIDIVRGIAPIQRTVARYGVALSREGAFEATTTRSKLPGQFNRYIQAILAVDEAERSRRQKARPDKKLVQEAIPLIQARNPNLPIERRVAVAGASNAVHIFDVRHGDDLIDVITPKPVATGAEMRKVADVINGPFVEGMSPLIIIDDRDDFVAAEQEMRIILSVSRVMSFSELARKPH